MNHTSTGHDHEVYADRHSEGKATPNVDRNQPPLQQYPPTGDLDNNTFMTWTDEDEATYSIMKAEQKIPYASAPYDLEEEDEAFYSITLQQDAHIQRTLNDRSKLPFDEYIPGLPSKPQIVTKAMLKKWAIHNDTRYVTDASMKNLPDLEGSFICERDIALRLPEDMRQELYIVEGQQKLMGEIESLKSRSGKRRYRIKRVIEPERMAAIEDEIARICRKIWRERKDPYQMRRDAQDQPIRAKMEDMLGAYDSQG